jgi:hypothetical protein
MSVERLVPPPSCPNLPKDLAVVVGVVFTIVVGFTG